MGKGRNSPHPSLSIPVSGSEQETMISLECHWRSKAHFEGMRENFEKEK